MALGGFRYMSAAKTLVVLSHSSIVHHFPSLQAAYLHLSQKVVALAFSASRNFSVSYHITAFYGVNYQ
jgi:hypothetical protein